VSIIFSQCGIQAKALEAFCQANEGVQACLDRHMMNCIVGQASQQMQNGLADAMAASMVQLWTNLKKTLSISNRPFTSNHYGATIERQDQKWLCLFIDSSTHNPQFCQLPITETLVKKITGTRLNGYF
jgi:hypothetical protein